MGQAMRLYYFGLAQAPEKKSRDSDGRSADHDGITSGLVLHLQYIFRPYDVSVSYYRN